LQCFSLALALIVTGYWIGVAFQIVRVSRLRGRPPAVVPATWGLRVMWVVWTIVIGLWIVQPWLVALDWAHVLAPIPALVHPIVQGAGVAVAALALGATIVCWAKMGTSWQMAIDESTRTRLVTKGPYRLVRHPIYSLSATLMVATVLVAPTPGSIPMALVHISFLVIEAVREERHLRRQHGDVYEASMGRTGRFLPRLTGPVPGAD
jgi:protein-S-isoprenylcysteine O-methyltransferase Ste14